MSNLSNLSTTATPQKVYLKDYTSPQYLIPKIQLEFDIISDQKIIVTNTMTIIPNPSVNNSEPINQLIFNGDNSFLSLHSVHINNEIIEPTTLTDTTLTLGQYTTEISVKIVTSFNPSQNLALEGIYTSDGILCSQNEPQGFRRITYFMDRPDVMSRYTVTMTADKNTYPLLLSNGNKISTTPLEGGRHQVVWEDPFPKPCYLFAFVAGDLGQANDTFITTSKREIQLEIYVDHGNEAYTQFAMDALKKSMKWDEDHYGREYDLDLYMIVAVDAFNMGAMENKGLNIFNTQYVLGDSQTATDQDIQGIDRVIAHEYFHNWTGNRITLRDWFQLTLKEGLTVFRDQQYSADQHHHAVKRIQDVFLLRNHQFVEDSGPMAHPIRPESFIEVNNFYTVTVYEKGAEIIRLYHTLLGPELYRKAMDLYFQTYDGMAITTTEFRSVMETVSGQDLSQFDAWYSQSGTPTVTLTTTYKEDQNKLIITAEQTGLEHPALIPIKIGLLSQSEKPSGKPISFQLTESGNVIQETVLQLVNQTQSFTLYGVKKSPILSSFREFSAPVYIKNNLSAVEKCCIFQYDTDTFNRWDAGQQLYTEWINTVVNDLQNKQPLTRHPQLQNAIKTILENYHIDPAITTALITLPGLSELLEQLPHYDVTTAVAARETVLHQSICHHESQLLDIYETLYKKRTKDSSIKCMDNRQLQNTCLLYLGHLTKYQDLAYRQFSDALTMTDQLAALKAVTFHKNPLGEKALLEFYEQWKNRPLLMNKWLAIQVSTTTENSLAIVQKLESHDCFDAKNPNKIRALYGTFSSNLKWFHQKSGKGYHFLADKIITIDQFNPSMASRLANTFKKCHALDPHHQTHMKTALTHINSQERLSKNTKEIIENRDK
jgi:aminopeptidase N